MNGWGDSSDAKEVLRHFKQLPHLRRHEIADLFRETLREWDQDNAPRLGAALAFYSLLSLAPLLVVIVAVGALAFGREAAQGQLAWQIQGLVGSQEAITIQALIQQAYKPGTGVLATLLGILTLVWGASAVTVELRAALHTIWHVPDRSDKPYLSLIRVLTDRLYGFALVFGVGFLLVVSLVWSAWIAAMGRLVGAYFVVPELVLHIVTSVISFIVITILFAALYKFLPDVHLRWSDVIIGASFTSAVFTIGKQLIGLYLGKASIVSTYGAAGSLVVVVVWVYYSAQLFFLGAEFTKVYTGKFGSHLTRQLTPVPSRPDSVVVNASDNLAALGGADEKAKPIATRV